MQSNELESETSLKDKLKSIYRAHDHLPKLIDDDGIQQQSLEEYYIKLQVVLNRDFAASHQEAMQDIVAGDKESIEINNIFAKSPNQREESEKEINKILLLGTAGIGKSTLMHYLSYLWSENKHDALWSDKFDYVFRVRLKVLLDSNWSEGYNCEAIEDNRLECFLHRCLKIEDRKQVKSLKLTVDEIINIQDKDKVLLLLDGYDEVQHIANQERNKEIFKDIFDYKHVIMTSRPNALKDSDIQKFDRQVENIGFDNEGISQYVTRNFEDEKELAKKLTNFLALNGEVQDICRTPINMALLCIIWHDDKIRDQLTKESASLNISRLYEEIVVYLGKRYLSKFKDADIDNIANEQIFRKPELKFLQRIAYKSLEETGKLITSLIIQKNINDLDIVEINKYGLTRTEGSSKKVIDNNHQFIHLTFQEYLTAYYLQEELLNSEPEAKRDMAEFIANHRNEPKYLMTLKFLSGMVSRSDNKELVRNFWEILSCNIDGVLELGLESKIILLMHLLSQSMHDGKIDSRIPNLDKIVKIIDDAVLQDITRWEIQIVRSGYLSEKIEEKINNILDNYKNSGKSKEFIAALEVVTNLIYKSKNHDKESLCRYFIEIIKSKVLPWQIKKTIFTKLNQIIDGTLNEELLIDILDVCKNNFEDSNVQSFVKAILLKIVKVNSTIDMELIDLLKSLLENDNSNFKHSVAEFLTEIVKAHSTLAKAVINLTKLLFKDSDLYIRKLASDTLIKIIKSYPTKEVIELLQPLLKIDDDWSFKRSVRYALQEVVKADSTLAKEVIMLLPPIFKDLGDVQQVAADTLQEIVRADSTLTKQGIELLLPLLNDLASYVRNSANDALIKVIKVTADKQVMELLKPLFENNDRDVKISAANALQERIKADSTLAKEGIKLLTPLFDNNDHDVKISAANALQEIVKADSTLAKEGIKLLTPLFDNNDHDVKISAANALQEIVKADSNLAKEGIKLLTPLFDNNDHDVKISAANALQEIAKADSNLAQEVTNLLKLLFEKDNADDSTPSIAEILKSHLRDIKHVNVQDIPTNQEGQLNFIKYHLLMSEHYDIKTVAVAVLDKIVRLKPESIKIDMIELLYPVIKYDGAESTLINMVSEVAQDKTVNVVKILEPLLTNKIGYNAQISGVQAIIEVVKVNQNYTDEAINLLELVKNGDSHIKNSVLGALKEFLPKSTLVEQGFELIKHLLKDADSDFEKSAIKTLKDLVIDIDIDLDIFAESMKDDLTSFRSIIKQVMLNKLDVFQNAAYSGQITAILKIIDVTDNVDEELDKKLNIAAKKALYDLPDKLYHSSLEMINKNFEEINQTKESSLYLKKLCHMVFGTKKIDDIEKELIVKCIKTGISIVATNTGKVMFEGQTYRLDLENDEATAKNFEDIIDVVFEQTSNNDTHLILENTGSLLPVAASDILDVSSLISKNHTLNKSSCVVTLLASTTDNQEFIFLETRDAFGYVEIYINKMNSVPVNFHPNQQQEKRAEVFEVLPLGQYNATTAVLQNDEILPSDDINIKELLGNHDSKKFIVDAQRLLIGDNSTVEHQIMNDMNTRINYAEKDISELKQSLEAEVNQLKDSIKKNLNQEQEKVQKIEENLNSILKKSESLNNEALISCIRDIIRKELETIKACNINNLEQKFESLARKVDQIDQEGQAQDLWYVKDIRYDSKLSDELIEESILYNQDDLLLAGFISP